jgi:ribose 1,5-bisphosphokinase|nr:phosphonate metabolism protein/1,5-bisphosphokinase (PRPP-forming) PhnN [Pseudorhizobium flavum]CAD6595616.1 phosphonate metabolism protein/1,5-bisphosphokinase (PRPP-forming) PhnN [Pseudorhizobium flavum]
MGDASSARRTIAGRLIVVVGPSGAGKDTLMSYAAQHLKERPEVVFVRRVITRDGGSGGEDHDAVSDAAFRRMSQSGGFAVWWEAHGLCYGIPIETRHQIDLGHVVVANGSRAALPHFSAAFPAMTVINVTARPEVLATRLESRGRETRDEILRRLQRSSPQLVGPYELLTIDNSGSIEEAGQAMVNAVTRYLPAFSCR